MRSPAQEAARLRAELEESQQTLERVCNERDSFQVEADTHYGRLQEVIAERDEAKKEWDDASAERDYYYDRVYEADTACYDTAVERDEAIRERDAVVEISLGHRARASRYEAALREIDEKDPPLREVEDTTCGDIARDALSEPSE